MKMHNILRPIILIVGAISSILSIIAINLESLSVHPFIKVIVTLICGFFASLCVVCMTDKKD